jgi:tRNA(Ile)-lysidine synthase
MLEQAIESLRTYCRLDPSRPVVVGVSGGPDSLCLMDMLQSAGYTVIVAHFDHQLRPESTSEAQAVEKMVARRNLVCAVESADVRGVAEQEGRSIEEAARLMRYRFLFAQARRYNAQAVAVGHTADDQVETVLMHFLRGAGLAGLKGMSYRTLLPSFDAGIPVVRPLLDVWREETVVYCAAHSLHPHFDPSNTSLNFFRNRLRHVLIPSLESYNPRFREVVWRSARALAGDYEALNSVVEDAWRECLLEEGSGFISFDACSVAAQPDGVQRLLIRQAIKQLRSDLRDANFAASQRALDVIANANNTTVVDLVGGLRLFREGQRIYVADARAGLPTAGWPQMPMSPLKIVIPAWLDLGGGWEVKVDAVTLEAGEQEQAIHNGDPFTAWFDAASLPGPLCLRAPLPGDRIQPLGMDGHSIKLSDLFVNAKIPRRARENWPLLCSGDTVIWVVGFRVAHATRIIPETRQAVRVGLSCAPVHPDS